MRRTRAIETFELSGEAEQLGNECGLRDRVVFRYPSHSALADHLHCFDALQGPSRGHERSITFRQPGPLFHEAMVLFHYIVQVFALPQAHSMWEDAFRFQSLDGGWIGWVLVHVNNPRHGIAR